MTLPISAEPRSGDCYSSRGLWRSASLQLRHEKWDAGGVIANVSGAEVQERAPVYFRSRTSDRPAALLNSLASIVPSLSESAALKRFSTIGRNSLLYTVP